MNPQNPQNPYAGPPADGAPPAWPTYPGYAPQPVPEPAPPKPPWYRVRRNQLLAGAGALVVVLAVVLPLTLTGGPGEQTLTVKMSLLDPEDGGDCATGGTGGYDDISPGKPFTVKDENGKIIGSATLPDTGEEENPGCTWTMRIPVPDSAQQYAVGGDDNRGRVTYSHADLVRKHWTVHLVLGQ